MTRRERNRSRGWWRCDVGSSLADLLVVVAVATLVTAMALPGAARVIETGRGRQAAAFVAGRLRSAQQDALATSRSVGLVFDEVAGRWTFRVCEDRNRNGLRRAELAGGPDLCLGGPFDVVTLFPGVKVDVDGGLRGPEGEPGSADPVRFGRSNIASFSSSGSSTAGSVFLRAAGQHFLVRVAGVTGRVRVFRHNPSADAWEEL